MSDRELMELILEKVRGVKEDIRDVKSDIRYLKGDIQRLKNDVKEIRENVGNLNRRINGNEGKMANEAVHSIYNIEENELSPFEKLEMIIKAEKEQKEDNLSERVRKLERDVAMLKKVIT